MIVDAFLENVMIDWGSYAEPFCLGIAYIVVIFCHFFLTQIYAFDYKVRHKDGCFLKYIYQLMLEIEIKYMFGLYLIYCV